MQYTYETQGTCSKAIIIDIDENTHIIQNATFIGGCMGNTQGIAMLVRGQKAEDVIGRLQGISCGMKPTSCPDQLAKALAQVINK